MIGRVVVEDADQRVRKFAAKLLDHLGDRDLLVETRNDDGDAVAGLAVALFSGIQHARRHHNGDG